MARNRWAVAVAAWAVAGCHPTTAQGSDCSAPPAWQELGAKPGAPEAELAACLKDKAYDARNVKVPFRSKVAGIIAQCEVDVDRFDSDLVLDGPNLRRLKAIEEEAQREATAAILAYQSCADR